MELPRSYYVTALEHNIKVVQHNKELAQRTQELESSYQKILEAKDELARMQAITDYDMKAIELDRFSAIDKEELANIGDRMNDILAQALRENQ